MVNYGGGARRKEPIKSSIICHSQLYCGVTKTKSSLRLAPQGEDESYMQILTYSTRLIYIKQGTSRILLTQIKLPMMQSFVAYSFPLCIKDLHCK